MRVAKTGVMVVAMAAAASAVWAQTPAPQPATAQPTAPASAAPGATPAAASPHGGPGPGAAPVEAPPEAYTYDPAGRRDPFISLLTRGADSAPGGKKTAGLSALSANDLVVKGILNSRGSFVALVSGPDGKTFTAHVNDRLLDGVIRNVSPQGLVIMQEVNDPLSVVKQREVRKGLRAAEDGK